jgi:hypothetical protein
MPEEPKNTYVYKVLRYTPNVVRDEWVNIGILLEQAAQHAPGEISKRAIKMIEEPSEFARVKRLHPNTDEKLLRALPQEFDSRIRATSQAASAYLERLDQTLSNALQFSPQRAVFADDFDAELDRLFDDHVAPPARKRTGFAESTRAGIKRRANDAFKLRRVPKLQRNIPAEQFTEPGDPLFLDYGYQNGARGYLQAVALDRDPAQPKVLAYTAKRVREQVPGCEFTAITEAEPGDSRRHQFVLRLFADEGIRIVPLSRIDRFAEELRLRLQ